ncbi:MFS transporter [Duganella hordei]|uniref:MFS transporter n=1 Tax=Duganella hordei TaxID=2865934 RepID=UPI0030E9C325
MPASLPRIASEDTSSASLSGLPCGALADLVDRRRYLILTQCWVAAVALLLWLAVLSGMTSPALLLGLTFANGIGLAMRWPVFAAIVPDLVPRAQLPAALALNGVSMNASRIIGPLLAGALIASAGTAWVFALNAVLSTMAALLIMRWRHAPVPSPARAERLSVAILAGVRFAVQSAPLKALLLPRWREAMSRETLVLRGAIVQSAAMCGVAFSTHVLVAAPIMFVAGMAWIATANALIVSVQLSLPDWVRARGMAMYQMAIMGASAAGAALWGQVAALGGLRTSLLCAAASGAVAMQLAHRFRTPR